MSTIFAKWFRRNVRKREQEHPADGARVVISGPYGANGVRVGTPQEALCISAVYRAVSLISESIAKMPLQLMRYNRAGKYYEADYNERLYRLLSLRPREDMSAYAMIRAAVQQVLLKGNAYIVPAYNADGDFKSLSLISPEAAVSYDTLRRCYVISDPYSDIRSGKYTPEEVIHLKGPSIDGGKTGVSVITFAARTLGIAATGDAETLDRFATGGKYKAVYQQETDTQQGFTTGEYDPAEMENKALEIEKKLNGGRSIIALSGEGKLSPLSMTSADMQFLESRKFTVTEIARFFSVPKEKMMDDGSGNYKSVEKANTYLFNDALAPIIAGIEQEMEAKLIPESLFGKKHIRFDVSALYAADPISRVEWESKQLANGTLTVNDLRRSHGKPPYERGDEPRISANLKSFNE